MRLLRLALQSACTTAIVFLVLSSAGVAGASGTGAPTVVLSTRVLGPGATVVVTGSHWPPGTALAARICGADAVAGTADCAPGSTADMVATGRGLIWGTMVATTPPVPCPCAVLVTGASSSFSDKIQVTVVGASSAPVPSLRQLVAAPLHLAALRVTGASTLLSDLGGQASRVLNIRLTNVAPYPVTAVLVGRWGSGRSPEHLIAMPNIGTLSPGRSVTVHVPFHLSSFAVGSYAVRVTAEVPGVTPDPSLTVFTDQWPYLLFACGLVIVLLAAVLVVLFVLSIIHLRADP